MPKKILLIAGEASGDHHAASLVESIKKIDKDITFFGIGGVDMQNAGINIIYNMSGLAVIGPVDVIRHYKKIRAMYYGLCNYIKQHKPDYAILIDCPGFNLKIAKVLKSLSIPIIYYISPQIWAWGPGRIKKIRRLINKMVVFFDFEESLYRKEGVDVSFVGHPLLDDAKPTQEKYSLFVKYGLSPEKITIGILPGSRNYEAVRILPIMVKSAKLIQKKLGDNNVQFLLPLAKTLKPNLIDDILKNLNFKAHIIRGDTYNVISMCKAAMVASGTATLETALLGVPMAIVYKVGLLTYCITRSIIKIPYIGLVNVVANKMIVPEFLQYKATPGAIADRIVKLVQDESLWQEQKRELLELKNRLGSPGASARAAKEVVAFLKTTVAEP
ncbi:MAG: lipid-A-disaccharide synthase [Candidatus Omnitrophota bacterium]